VSDCRDLPGLSQKGITRAERRTWIVIALSATMMIIEIVAGLAYGSMALLADGLHMASHAMALGIAAFAYFFARRYALDPRFSFGTGKVNALGGFAGAVLLAGFALVMAAQSVERLLTPVEIALNSAILVAMIGLVVNGVCAWILSHDGHSHQGHGTHEHQHSHPHVHAGREHSDYNLRSAYLHVVADALTSLLAIFALLAAKYLGLNWMDPAMGIIGALLITRWSFGLVRDTSAVLLDSQAPAGVCNAIRRAVEADDGAHVRDLHVWAIGPSHYAAIVAVTARDPKPAAHYKRLIAANDALVHVTVEVSSTAS
jgi:cation diffusion facilitator family transporter